MTPEQASEIIQYLGWITFMMFFHVVFQTLMTIFGRGDRE